MMLFLKTVFVNNTAEDMKFYVICLKKPNRFKVCSFLQQAATLNGYVVRLPSSYHLRDATEATKKDVPHDDAEFAMNMLHAMPKM